MSIWPHVSGVATGGGRLCFSLGQHSNARRQSLQDPQHPIEPMLLEQGKSLLQRCISIMISTSRDFPDPPCANCQASDNNVWLVLQIPASTAYLTCFVC